MFHYSSIRRKLIGDLVSSDSSGEDGRHDDLSIALSACRTGCCGNNTTMNLFSPSSIGLRALVHVWEIYGIRHEIRLNHKKSAIMICRGQYMKKVHPPLYTLNVEVIKEVDCVIYLGHIISSNDKDDKDSMCQCQQVHARGNVSLRKCLMCSMAVKVNLFNTYCSPIGLSTLRNYGGPTRHIAFND